jgi:hypothetical protein
MFFGNTNSLSIAFKPSAMGCNNPQNITVFGPLRLCNAAIILRSAKVKKATATNKGTMVIKNNIINSVINI